MKMLRYSEIPRDISADSLAALKIVEGHENGSYKITGDDTTDSICKNEFLMDVKERKNSSPMISGAPGPPFTCYNYSSLSAVPASIKTQSLPNHANTSLNRTNNYSCAIFDVLRILPEDFATQLTLLDMHIFITIQPDELTSCAWNKKNKLTVAPNVVAFTRRFNHVIFWTVQEILARPTPKQRSEVLSHFIRIAKKLYDLNNLHSLFAIVSALLNASIYRLSKTWASLSKRDRQTFDKLSEVFSTANNRSNLRSHIENLKLPCIPYLGLYLTDLVYIDMAHPHSGGLESQQRTMKMNNILRVISNFQHSDYSHLLLIAHIQDYLNSIRYIEELQKFVEDDQYKLSLKLEPPPSPPPSSSSCSSKESVVMDAGAAAIASLNLSPAKASGGSLRLHAVTSGNKFIPSHRKSRSLGTKFRSASLPRNFHKTGYPIVAIPWGIFSKTHLKEPGKNLHLLDDSELEDPSGKICDSPSPTSDLPLETSQSTTDNTTLLPKGPDDLSNSENQVFMIEGCLRRKTILKGGKKPTVTAWQRYWFQVWTNYLVYFSPKTFKGHQRSDFKHVPCKLFSLIGCQISLSDSSLQGDSFHIADRHKENIYKFRAGSKSMAERWCKYLQEAANKDQTPLPSDLMSFID